MVVENIKTLTHGSGRMSQSDRNTVFPDEVRALGTKGPEQGAGSYSLRCAPQVHGPVAEALKYARGIVEIEINSRHRQPVNPA